MRHRRDTTTIHGANWFSGDLAQAAEAVVARTLAGVGGYACLVNAHVVVTARRDDMLRESLQGAWLVFPDGAPVAWLRRRLGSMGERIPGPDLMPRVIEHGRKHDLRHFLFGSTEGVLADLEHWISSAFPGARVVGRFAPPFADLIDGIEPIRAARPDVVWCGLGAPKQELWMRDNAERLRPAVIIGVGAAFDFCSGSKKRAPVWMRDHGLEWLHRLASEPRRLHRRYLRTNAEFFAFALAEFRRAARGGRS